MRTADRVFARIARELTSYAEKRTAPPEVGHNFSMGPDKVKVVLTMLDCKVPMLRIARELNLKYHQVQYVRRTLRPVTK